MPPIPLNQDGRRFWLAGLGDQLEAMDDLPGTLRQIGDASPTILLAHEPNIFKKVPKQVTLTLLGPYSRRAGLRAIHRAACNPAPICELRIRPY